MALSRDGQFAFVTLENSGTMAVFNLRAALASGLRTSGFVGDVRLGINPIGMTVSRDGQWLYVTTQKRNQASEQGTLTMINVARAETDPARSVQATVAGRLRPGPGDHHGRRRHRLGDRPGQQRAARVLRGPAAHRPGPGADRQGRGRARRRSG